MRRPDGEVRTGERFGPYELIRLLAVGGMAEIYLAKATGISGFEKYVALKVIHPNYSQDEHFIEMLVEEAKIAVHLTQPNIVQIFDLGRIGDVHYIAMEYVDGPDLYHIMRTITSVGERVGFDVAAFMALETCAALDYAHRCTDQLGMPLRIIHRDISPQNILVSRAGEVKLADFGIAKATVRARQTAVGVIKGKYYYMSPEQAWGDPIDHRTDLFSTGVVLYEVIVGQMLYLEEDLSALLDRVRKCEIEPPSRLRPDLPPELERIVMKAVSRRPEDRFQSAYDFQTALTSFLFSYAPNFTVGRLRNLVDHMVAVDEKRNTLQAENIAQAMAPAAGADGGEGKVGHDSLMEKSEFRPLTTHSLLSMDLDVSEPTSPVRDLPSYDAYDDDATLISDPPMMDSPSGPAPKLPVLATFHGGQRPGPAGPPPPPGSDGREGAPADEWDAMEESTTVHSGHRGGQTRPERPLHAALPPLPPGLTPGQPGGQPSGGRRSQDTDQEMTIPRVEPQRGPQGASFVPPAAAAPPGAPGFVQPAPQWDPGQAPAPYPGPAAGPDGAAYGAPQPVPAPGYQPVFGAPPGPAEQGAEAMEAMLQRQRKQRHMILLGVLVCIVLISVAMFIITARSVTSKPGSVQVITNPPGAKVYYRGKYVGDTPHRLDSLTLDEVHWVRLESPRCESRAVKLNVEAGKTKTLRVKLKNCDKQR